LRFIVKVKVQPAKDGYPAKNELSSVITPDKQTWHQVTQVARPATGGTNTAPAPINRPTWAE
jgi:hypothetical protein